ECGAICRQFSKRLLAEKPDVRQRTQFRYVDLCAADQRNRRFRKRSSDAAQHVLIDPLVNQTEEAQDWSGDIGKIARPLEPARGCLRKVRPVYTVWNQVRSAVVLQAVVEKRER